MKKITIKAASTRQALETHGADLVETHLDTMKAARARVRHLLSREYARLAEMSDPFGFAQIEVGGVVDEEFEAR